MSPRLVSISLYLPCSEFSGLIFFLVKVLSLVVVAPESILPWADRPLQEVGLDEILDSAKFDSSTFSFRSLRNAPLDFFPTLEPLLKK
jgi:hypothetical protein